MLFINSLLLDMLQKVKNIIIPGSGNRPITLDIFFEKETGQKPAIIYAHGFNGFKDWGNFDLIAEKISEAGFAFVKFNFSHNGTTPQQPEEFSDLEGFGKNNYSIELNDVKLVTDWVCDAANLYAKHIDKKMVCLIGHSMGGGIAILHAATDKRISKLVTWAAISQCKTPWGNWPAEKMDEWKRSGVQYYTNSRTKQQLPMYYQLFEDYRDNEQKLDIKQAMQSLTIPVLICQGTADAAVPIASALLLKEWQPAAILYTLDTDHVFGRKHPWAATYLPPATEAVVVACLQFLL